MTCLTTYRVNIYILMSNHFRFKVVCCEEDKMEVVCSIALQFLLHKLADNSEAKPLPVRPRLKRDCPNLCKQQR